MYGWYDLCGQRVLSLAPGRQTSYVQIIPQQLCVRPGILPGQHTQYCVCVYVVEGRLRQMREVKKYAAIYAAYFYTCLLRGDKQVRLSLSFIKRTTSENALPHGVRVDCTLSTIQSISTHFPHRRGLCWRHMVRN